MNRIKVYSYPTDPAYDEDGPTLVSWFDADRAERFGEDTEWNGNNHISVNTRTQWSHEELYLTAQGRWVLGKYSNYQGTMPTYEFIDGERAKTWLTVNMHDAVVEKHFGEVEEERGPGRPGIGHPVNVRFPQDVLDRIDIAAEAEGIPRAEKIRRIVAAGLAPADTAAA